MKLETIRIGNGSKATVVLHGFMGSAKNLRTLAQRWSEQDASRSFLLMDLRGHGTSPALEDSTSLHDMATDVLETARSEQAQFPVDIVGHSLGGRVALAALRDSPNDIRSVALLDITPSPLTTVDSGSARVLSLLRQAPSSAPDRRTLREWFIGEKLHPLLADWLLMNVHEQEGQYVWRFDREALAKLHKRVNPEDLWPTVERFGSQVRSIRGGASRYVTDADVERFRRAGVEVVTLEGAGHDVHVEALEPLLAALTSASR